MSILGPNCNCGVVAQNVNTGLPHVKLYICVNCGFQSLTHQKPKGMTYLWELSFGYSPVEVWQFATTQEEARRLVKNKLEKLDFREQTFVEESEDSFGFLFIGPYSIFLGSRENGLFDSMLTKLDKDADQVLSVNKGSGFVSALDG